jgi:ATP-dependent Clp protease ATP-binding subunit ClpA
MPTTPAPEIDAGSVTDAALKAEVESMRKALAAANREAADRRKKLDAYEQAEAARKEAEMSEVEKAVKRANDLQAQLDAERQARRDGALRSAVTVAAIGAGFHNPDDAWAFLPAGAVSLDEGEKAQGVEDALKELVKARPYLIKGQATPTTPSGTPDGAAKGAGKPQVDRAAAAAKYGIQTYD